jgi:hypothetical protein
MDWFFNTRIRNKKGGGDAYYEFGKFVLLHKNELTD